MATKIKKDFIYKGRRCIVLEMSCNFMITPYCCGYVELTEEEAKHAINDDKERPSYDYFNKFIQSDEMTFMDNLNPVEGLDTGNTIFIGFDSAHYWNDEHPESKTPDYVANTCKKIVDELERRKK